MASSILRLKNLFLRSLSCIYMFAFTSLYVQIRGLYGTSGVLPAHVKLEFDNQTSLMDQLLAHPTLLYLAPHVGLNVQYMMELLVLCGMIFSLFGLLSQRICTTPLFILMWSIYLSVYQVGQVFLHQQWDLLLLEAGFLAILLAPLTPAKSKATNPSDPLVFLLLRFLLFRVLVSATVLKLKNRSPAWWSLTALSAYYQSQALPTYVAWYIHSFPDWFHKTCTMITILIEMVIPIFFFSPTRNLRQFAYFSQFILQLMIFTHGNYNWFNALIVVLTLSLVDDRFVFNTDPSNQESNLARFFNRFVYTSMTVLVCYFFSPKIGGHQLIDWKISFTPDQFDRFLYVAIPASIVVVTASVVFLTVSLFYSVVVHSKTYGSFLGKAIQLTIYSMVAFFLFGLSVVQFSSLDGATRAGLPSFLHSWNFKFARYHFSSTYGWYRPIDSTGRPDLVLEAAVDPIKGPWIEIPFKYKVGDVDGLPTFFAPHQPRLDWQMWSAATDDYHRNPWLSSLVHRLLTNQPNVIKLLDILAIRERFKDVGWPPKYIRTSVYVYQFTSNSNSNKKSANWWRRRKATDYLPAYSADNKPLIDYLTKLKLLGQSDRLENSNLTLKYMLDIIWSFFESFLEPQFLIWALAGQAATVIVCFL